MNDLSPLPGEQILTITRGQLKRLDACCEGMRLFNSFVGGRNKNVLRVIWSPLAQLWLAKNHSGFAAWLYDCGVTPRFSLSSADLSSADLRWADLRWANLRWANLRWADLSSADLRSADLRSADLRWANLSSADLSSADLRSADLRWANLSPALRPADIAGAWRTAEDAPVLGWHLRDGRLERTVAS